MKIWVEEVFERQKSHSKAVKVGSPPLRRPLVWHTGGDWSLQQAVGTSPGPLRERAISASKFSLRDPPALVPATSPTNSNWFEFLLRGVLQVPATCFSKRLMSTIRGTSPGCDQSRPVNSSWDSCRDYSLRVCRPQSSSSYSYFHWLTCL